MGTFQIQRKKDLARDLLAGLSVALVSVPVSMVCAMVAGLPPRYGLYGALLPPLVFALLTTSPQFVFGVDAAPAALAGVLLAELGIAAGSAEAAAVMPAVTLLTALWLFLFRLLRAGRFAKYISEPVLGGCVSGIGCTVILSLLPKLFGGASVAGEAPALLVHAVRQAASAFHPLSFALGLGTVLLLTVSRRLWPKMPAPALMLVVGMLLTAVFHVDRYGVALCPGVESGLPPLVLPDFTLLRGHVERTLLSTLTIALVITSETLVSTRSLALEHGDSIDNERELLAYAAGNLAAALYGSCPVNGSIFRTRWAIRFEVRSQWMALSAFGTIALFLLFGTDLVSLLPVPVAAGIVIACLLRMLEFGLAVKLWKIDRSEFFIFAGAFLAEMLGLMAGVLAGVLLSFVTFTMRATRQPREFLGCLKGEEGFFSLEKTPRARPILGALLYQFNGALFFASIDDFESDLKNALRDDTRLIVVTGLTGVDVTAAERLLTLYRSLKARGVAFYLAGHSRSVNEQLIAFGAEELIREGAVKPRFTQALSAGGLTPPYPLDRAVPPHVSPGAAVEDFTWAYGAYAPRRLKQLAHRLARELLTDDGGGDEALTFAELDLARDFWNTLDEEEFLDLVEEYLSVNADRQHRSAEVFLALERSLLDRFLLLERKLVLAGDLDGARRVLARRSQRGDAFLRRHPESAEELSRLRKEYLDALRREAPELEEAISALEHAPEETVALDK